MARYKKLKLDNKTCLRLLDIVDVFVEGNRKMANEMLDRLYEEQQKEDTKSKDKDNETRR